MKSFEQLAQAAYDAAAKKAMEVGIREKHEAVHWHELEARAKEVWIAAATQLWAEFAAVH